MLLLLTLVGVGLKLYYSGAADDEPRWLLAATARVFSAASGIPFHFAEGQGYLSSDGRLLLYRGCSGLNFLVLTGFLAGLLPLALRLEAPLKTPFKIPSKTQLTGSPHQRSSGDGANHSGDDAIPADGSSRSTGDAGGWPGLVFYYSVACVAALGFTLLANTGRMLALLALAATFSPEVLHPGAAHLSVGSFVYLVFLILFYSALRLTMRRFVFRSETAAVFRQRP